MYKRETGHIDPMLSTYNMHTSTTQLLLLSSMLWSLLVAQTQALLLPVAACRDWT